MDEKFRKWLAGEAADMQKHIELYQSMNRHFDARQHQRVLGFAKRCLVEYDKHHGNGVLLERGESKIFSKDSMMIQQLIRNGYRIVYDLEGEAIADTHTH